MGTSCLDFSQIVLGLILGSVIGRLTIPFSKLIEWIKHHDVGFALNILSFVYGGFGVGWGELAIGGFPIFVC